MPPGARTLLGEIELTTSVRVRLSAASKLGSTVTMNAGCVVPVTLTLEIPGSCSIAGTIALLATEASTDSGYFDEISASDTTVGSLGSATRIDGAVMVEGRLRWAAWIAFSTLAMFSVSVDCTANEAEMLTWPVWIVVSMWSR